MTFPVTWRSSLGGAPARPPDVALTAPFTTDAARAPLWERRLMVTLCSQVKGNRGSIWDHGGSERAGTESGFHCRQGTWLGKFFRLLKPYFTFVYWRKGYRLVLRVRLDFVCHCYDLDCAPPRPIPFLGVLAPSTKNMTLFRGGGFTELIQLNWSHKGVLTQHAHVKRGGSGPRQVHAESPVKWRAGHTDTSHSGEAPRIQQERLVWICPWGIRRHLPGWGPQSQTSSLWMGRESVSVVPAEQPELSQPRL